MQITASHNPAPWNGLKLFGGDGGVLTAARGREIKQLYDAGRFPCVAHDKLGHERACGKAEDWHRERVLQLVDVARIRSRGFHTLLDANGGAGGTLGKALLESLQGTRPALYGERPDGDFLHPPEPIAENLQTILPLVPQAGADAGFVLDPDADRLAIIDETGRYIGEELTLALAVLCRLRHERGPVGTSPASSTCRATARQSARQTSSRRCARPGRSSAARAMAA